MINHWIFLRGLTRGNVHWGEFSSLFKNSNPNSKIEFLELPGNGLNFEEETPTDPHAIIKILRERSILLRENEKIILCGISLGGMIALKWAELYPNEISSVTIINSSLKQLSPFYFRLSPFVLGKLFLTFFSSDPEVQEKLILDLTSNNSHNYSLYLKKFQDFSKQYPVSKTNTLRQLLLANNIKVDHSMAKKVRIIASKNDRLVSFNCSVHLSHFFQQEIIIHPSAGHDLPLDDPQWLIEALNLKKSD